MKENEVVQERFVGLLFFCVVFRERRVVSSFFRSLCACRFFFSVPPNRETMESSGPTRLIGTRPIGKITWKREEKNWLIIWV